MKKQVLWLDDMRCPTEFGWDKYISFYCRDDYDVTWVKSYDEFVNFISTNELPHYIFFDHDLGMNKSGMDCMKYLVNYLQDNNINPHSVIVRSQSSNPVGRENMLSLFNCFVKCWCYEEKAFI